MTRDAGAPLTNKTLKVALFGKFADFAIAAAKKTMAFAAAAASAVEKRHQRTSVDLHTGPSGMPAALTLHVKSTSGIVNSPRSLFTQDGRRITSKPSAR